MGMHIDYDDEDTFDSFSVEEKVIIQEIRKKERDTEKEIAILADLFQKNGAHQMQKRWLYVSRLYTEQGFSVALKEVQKEMRFE